VARGHFRARLADDLPREGAAVRTRYRDQHDRVGDRQRGGERVDRVGRAEGDGPGQTGAGGDQIGDGRHGQARQRERRPTEHSDGNRGDDELLTLFAVHQQHRAGGPQRAQAERVADEAPDRALFDARRRGVPDSFAHPGQERAQIERERREPRQREREPRAVGARRDDDERVGEIGEHHQRGTPRRGRQLLDAQAVGDRGCLLARAVVGELCSQTHQESAGARRAGPFGRVHHRRRSPSHCRARP